MSNENSILKSSDLSSCSLRNMASNSTPQLLSRYQHIATDSNGPAITTWSSISQYLETTISMASKQSEKETMVSTKWGPVVVFNGTNYPFFENSVVMAMAAANTMGFLDETETIVAVPAETGSDMQWRIYQSYIKIKRYATSILNSAINDIQRAAIVELIQAGDIAGIWHKLIAIDQAQHPLFASNVRDTFYEETFDPKSQNNTAIHRYSPEPSNNAF
ncbi:hypothetical protein BOTNAR_0010g00220 [Botryotinia narcissicola]|uniref:Uncharacterized protein n=1 Tax=Botryotinia narcissicola TaxID=278944 RepID=A0A4Z1J7C2_9HELO|nr:hypothetical protein BOTNAR_0010g00220 [Botryotinia narcissicola]